MGTPIYCVKRGLQSKYPERVVVMVNVNVPTDPLGKFKDHFTFANVIL